MIPRKYATEVAHKADCGGREGAALPSELFYGALMSSRVTLPSENPKDGSPPNLEAIIFRYMTLAT
jgi:hypothetical protein